MPETEVNFIQQSSKKDSKFSNYVFGFGLAAAVGTTAFLTVGRDYLPELGFETENSSFGDGSVAIPPSLDWPSHWPKEILSDEDFENQAQKWLENKEKIRRD